MKLAASRGLVDVIIKRDRTRNDAAHINVVLRHTETETDFATLPLTAQSCDAVVIMIVASIVNALEARTAIGLNPDEEGLIRVRVGQDPALGKFDPLVATFLAAYERETDAALTRVAYEKGKDE
jgi:hypothetical protein